MIKHIGKTEYYSIHDGGELKKEEAKKDYEIVETKTEKFITNLSKHYGYHYVQIETNREHYCRKKPRQLELFNNTD